MVSADGSRGGVGAGGAWARLRPEALTSPGALPARAMKRAEAQLGTWGAPPEARLQAEMALGVGLRLPVCPSEPVTHAPGQGSSQLRGHRAITADGMEGLPGAASHCVSREPSPAPAPSRLGPHAFSFLETTTVPRTAGAVWGGWGTPRGWHHTKPCSPGLRKANLQEGCPGLGGPGAISELLLAVTVTWVWGHLSETPRPPPDNGPCLSGGTEGHGGGVGGRDVAAPLADSTPSHGSSAAGPGLPWPGRCCQQAPPGPAGSPLR